MNIWILMILVGIFTFSFRSSWIVSAGKFQLPKGIERALRYVPAAALSALIAPEFVVIQNQIDLTISNERMLAGIIAAIVAGVTKNMLATIGVGMLALWMLRLVTG